MVITYSNLQRLKKTRTVYTAGSFDLFHKGHVDYLRKLRESFPKHKIVVGILPDKRVAAKKGPERPIIGQRERLAVVDSIRYVDYAFICPSLKGGQNSTFAVLGRLRPNIIVYPEKKYLGLAHAIDAAGSKLVIQSRVGKTSTSRILKRIEQRLIAVIR